MSCVAAPVVGLTTSLSSVLSRSGEERVLNRTVGRFRASSRILISCMRGDLPPSCWTSFFMDATGGLSRWRLVQPPPLRDHAASEQGPSHLAVLTGSSLHGAHPTEQTVQHCTYRNLCCTVYADHVPAWHCTDDVALLTEQARGGVRQV